MAPLTFLWPHKRRLPAPARKAPRPGRSPRLEALECRALLTGGPLPQPTPLSFLAGHAEVARALSESAAAYSFVVAEASRVRALVHADAGDTRLSLLSEAGVVLVQSDGLSPQDRDDWVDLHLTAGATYVLLVEPLGGAAAFTLSVSVDAATPPGEVLPVGAEPWSAAGGDVNHDGVVDLVAANYEQASVSVLLGLGDGTFAPERRYAVGDAPNDVLLADLDGDGHLDLATANVEHGSLSVRHGSGDGTFGAEERISVGGAPSALAAADLDGDGRLDLVFTDLAASEVAVLRGVASGGYAAGGRFAVGLSPYDLAVGDFDGDGTLDVATADYDSGTVTVLAGAGDGTFRPAGAYAAGAGAYTILSADLNGDGRVDLATADTHAGTATVLFGRGDGTFLAPHTLTAGAGATTVAAADFDGDGRQDLAVTNLYADTISLFRGAAGGELVPLAPIFTGGGPLALVAADLDGDGAADLAYGRHTGGALSVALGRGDGTFRTDEIVDRGAGVEGVTTGDFDGDGRADLVTVNYATGDASVLLGRGDGTFQAVGQHVNGTDAIAAAAGDFNGDGRLDLVLSNLSTNDISLSLGRGDGTFEAAAFFAVGSVPRRLLAVDLDGDGRLDVVTANLGSGDVTALLGDGQGGFAAPQTFAAAEGARHLVAADFNGDGALDVATANSRAGSVTVLFGQGGGALGGRVDLAVGPSPSSVGSGDFDEDGVADLAVADEKGQVAVYLSRFAGGGGLTLAGVLATGLGAYDLAVGDFNADGHLDLATAGRAEGLLSVLAGHGDGTFGGAVNRPVGGDPRSVFTADFNGDGLDDVGAASFANSDVSVFLASAGGALSGPYRTAVARGAEDVAVADLNGDGLLDVVTVSPRDGQAYVTLGGVSRDGGQVLAVDAGGAASGVAVGDFNRDGRPDLAVARLADGALSVLLGIGDGSFGAAVSLGTGGRPTDVVGADVNGDGYLDLVATCSDTGVVEVFRGRGDGTFLPPTLRAAGAGASAVAAADLDGDGRVDLITANETERTVSVLYGVAGGGLGGPVKVALPAGPRSLAVADFNGDGRPDVAAGSPAGGEVYLLVGQPAGLALAGALAAPGGAISVIAGDFNNDGLADLAAARPADGATLWLGRGDGTFVEQAAAAPLAGGRYASALVAGDVDGDGRLDLVASGALGAPVSVSYGHGDGTFAAAALAPRSLDSSPLVADLNGDGVDDVAILHQSGAVLVRLGKGDGRFAPPRTANPSRPARDLTLVSVGGVTRLVAIDARADVVSFYGWDAATGAFTLSSQLATPALPARALGADFDGDGRDDLIVATASGRLVVHLQGPGGAFGAPAFVAEVGASPAGLALVQGAGGAAVAVIDAVSGDVRLVSVGGQLRYRAGLGLSRLTEAPWGQYLASDDAPVAVVAGAFDGDGWQDLVVVDWGANRLSLLRGTEAGGLLRPESPVSLMTTQRPVAVASGDFNEDGIADLAVLGAGLGELSVFLGDGHGGFAEHSRVEAGSDPAGLAVRDLDGDGHLDVLVGNGLGDVLILTGNGDGSLQPFARVDRGMALAAADLDGDGRDDFLYASEGEDRVQVEYSGPGQDFSVGRADGLRDPEGVRVEDLDGDGRRDLIVAHGGGNEVLFYRGLGGGQFAAPRGFFAGTSPTGVTVADLNGDGRLDLAVANEGSNDVSVLLGQGQGDGWSLTPGPRLRAGEGPVSTLARDLNGDGVTDLVVVNSRSDTVSLLRGVGGGYFDDRGAVVLATGRAPTGAVVGEFDGLAGLDLVTVNAGSGDLTFFSGLQAGRRLGGAGADPVGLLSGDFNQDGLTDLVVASSQDGQVSLFLGDAGGPTLFASQYAGVGARPASLALANVGEASVDIYVLGDGGAGVEVMTLRFAADEGPAPPPPGGPELPTADGPPTAGDQVADYSALGEGGLETVTTLQLVHAEAGPAAGQAPSGPGDTGPESQGASYEAGEGGPEVILSAGWEVGPDEGGGAPLTAPPDEAARNAFLMGLDELPFERALGDPATGPAEAPGGAEPADLTAGAWGLSGEDAGLVPSLFGPEGGQRAAPEPESKGPVPADDDPGAGPAAGEGRPAGWWRAVSWLSLGVVLPRLTARRQRRDLLEGEAAHGPGS